MRKKLLSKLLAGTLSATMAFGTFPVASFAMEATVSEDSYKYVIMNVPYTDFYEAYDLSDMAVWEVDDGVDAVSTATTTKFKGTDGLAKGTYNNGTYIMGVTLPVRISENDYYKLNNGLSATEDYYFTSLGEQPEAYSTLTINDEKYLFDTLTVADIDTHYLSVTADDNLLTGGYGDYQINLDGVTTSKGLQVGENAYIDYTIYGAILNITDNTEKHFGMTALENLWYGTRVPNVEIAWSIKGGQGLRRAHGSGDYYHQFDMNGGTISSVTLLTNLGQIEIQAKEGGLELPKYYTGDLSNLKYSINNGSYVLEISGVPNELKDVKISVSGGLATEREISDGQVILDGVPEAGVTYTLTISSSNYPDISRTLSTPITEDQKATLQKWINKAEELRGIFEFDSDLQEHVDEAYEMLAETGVLSADAEELIGELKEKVKKYYSKVSATATLKGSQLTIQLADVSIENLENPVYSLTYAQGRNTLTLEDGTLSALTVILESAPTVGTDYTLTIVSDNYQDIIVKSVTAEEVQKETPSGNTDKTNTPTPVNNTTNADTNTPAATPAVTTGQNYTVGNGTYKVTNVAGSNAGTVTVTGIRTQSKTINIAKTVTIQGKTYNVTGIGANAFKNNNKVTKITIGANVTSIGKNAFYGCKNVKSVVIKSKKLTAKTVKAGAFKKLGASNYKKVTVKVPSAKRSLYKKILTKKGLSSKIKIK